MNQYKQVNDFLKSVGLMVVSTISAETGGPQSGLVYYVPDEEGHIYFATANDSRKLVNVQKNANVSLVVVHESKPIELQIEGIAQEVTDASKKNAIISNIALLSNGNPKTTGWPPLLTLSMKSGVACIQVSIEYFKYSDFSIHPGTVIQGRGKELLFNYS
jgi:nitroimidazol reductase NimA-like FMN-containing flavoprotein (pyridoxamine 5'-phosphate oxidase superfamily)